MNPTEPRRRRPAGGIEHLQQMLLETTHAGDDYAFFHGFVREHQDLLLVAEDRKSNADAAHFRNAGNRLYLARKFDEALEQYNRSICFAELGTDQLGMGYANRSAVYFERGEYEFALYNIVLAKKHDYPEKFMPKLLARESQCRQKIGESDSKGQVPYPRMSMNVELNPKIPFLAKGISVNSGKLIAEKDFNPGDVIEDAEPLLTAVDFGARYQLCSHCGDEFNKCLIPCASCVHFMFCGEECRKKSWTLVHRFECPVATKLRVFSCFSLHMLPRLFFYGLSLFDDDLAEMKRFCEANEGAELNRFELDYSNLDRRELFSILHNTKPMSGSVDDVTGKLVAVAFFTALRANPAINSLTSLEDHKTFMIQSLCAYSRSSSALMSRNTGMFGMSWIYPATPESVQSCDPNAQTVFESGFRKMFLLRPVRAGEPITESCGPIWWYTVVEPPPDFKCNCVVCDAGPAGRRWRLLLERKLPPEMVKDLAILAQILTRDYVNEATKLNMLKQFIKRSGHVHPAKELGQVLAFYRVLLLKATMAEREARDRAWLKAACEED